MELKSHEYWSFLLAIVSVFVSRGSCWSRSAGKMFEEVFAVSVVSREAGTLRFVVMHSAQHTSTRGMGDRKPHWTTRCQW